MPLFGKKKDNKMDLPEVVDFSNDTWSFKGNPPVYQIQSDGFSYDIVDADGNDKNAISLGIAGMLIIVLNAKSPKIKEDELLPQFGKVIKTRNWHSMTVKEANFLVQTAIKKLTNSATSGDVFDLASYAPLEVKRVLLKSLFTISRMQLPPEYREEAEHRIIDDIVPDIFANADYELALLTGLIVKPDEKVQKPVSNRIETSPVLDQTPLPAAPVPEAPAEIRVPSFVTTPEPDSAFAELQKIYGRSVDSPAIREAAAAKAADQQISAGPVPAPSPVQPVSPAADAGADASVKIPSFGSVQPQNPFQIEEPAGGNVQTNAGIQGAMPRNPFENKESVNIPQPAAPDFSGPKPNNPFANPSGTVPYQPMQNIPQPPAPNYGGQQTAGYPYGSYAGQTNPQAQNQGYPQNNPYMGGYPYYTQQNPQQMWQQNMPMQQSAGNSQNSQQQFPPQSWYFNNMQRGQSMNGYPQNPNMPQYPENGAPSNPSMWQGGGNNPSQAPQQNNQNN